MKIQYISRKTENIGDFMCSTISKPMAFDSFDINIISLNDEDIWKTYKSGSGRSPLNICDDLENLNQMIRNKKKSKVVIILPQDLTLKYDYQYDYSANRKMHNGSINLRFVLKDAFVENLRCLNVPFYSYEYENNVTEINGNNLESAFYFSSTLSSKIVSISKNSEKPTSLYNTNNNVVYTFLKLTTYESIIDFLGHIGFKESSNDLPEWLEKICVFDDKILHDKMVKNRKKIDDLIEEENKIQDKINSNKFYKKSLISNGSELVEVVFKILEELFEIDLSGFVDKKLEDFFFEYNGVKFIGEIKGVNTNVKNEHIAQLDEHYSRHLDEVENQKTDEKLKAILIINHQRKTPVIDRQPINDAQIKKAERNESLIIETSTLLGILEKFRDNKLSSDDIFKLFSENVGLLKLQS